MSSSPSNAANCGCSRPAMASALPQSAVKIAVDMANEGLITKEDAVLRVTPDEVDTLLHPQFDENA